MTTAPVNSALRVADLDVMPASEAEELLRACCGASAWVEGMLSRRPFHRCDALLAAADEIWWSLGERDWREAFAHHPRIGETGSVASRSVRARDWSHGEQGSMRQAAGDVRTALADANASYEARFGYLCIICATGKSPDELLALTRARLANAPDAELRVAAEEQRKITRLRLAKLFQDCAGAAPT